MTANKDAFRKFRRNRAAMAALVYLCLMVVVAFSIPVIQEFMSLTDPATQNLSEKLLSPSFAHPFGTDALGRDLLARVIAGARISIIVGVVATLITIVIGVTYGAIAGFVGGATDNILMRIVDALYTLPFIFLVILLLGLFDRSLFLLFAALGAVQWLTMSRMVRGEILSLKTRDFVSAAKAAGSSPFRILFHHLLPNTLGVVIVYATLTVPVIILQEAFLSFLGLTVPGQEHSWGSLISEGLDAVNPVKMRWWLVVFPGIAISSTLLALNFIGDGLRDAFDPKTADS